MDAEDTYLTRDRLGIYGSAGPGPTVMGAFTLLGNAICNAHGEHLGRIEELIINMGSGRVDYVLLSAAQPVSDGDPGLLPVPFAALVLDGDRHCFLLHMTTDALRQGPWFKTARWPAMDDDGWAQTVHRFFGTSPLA